MMDDLEDIMLSEISQSQKTNTVQFYLYEVLRRVEFTETENRWWVPGAGAEGMGNCSLRTEIQVCKVKKF